MSSTDRNTSTKLPCGCSASAPCPVTAKMFAAGKRSAQYLYRHLEAGLTVTEARHIWAYARDGAVLKSCKHCGIEVSDRGWWRKPGGVWWTTQMPECQSKEALKLASARVRSDRRRGVRAA